MIYVPQALEATARRWVASYQEAWQLIEKISQASLERFLRGKEKVLIGGKRRKRP
jgi:molybdenum-dependent DNA-binding transcriptional regulator ModE